MQWSELPLNPNRRTLRQFGMLSALFLGVWAWRRVGSGDSFVPVILTALAAISALLAAVAPSAFRIPFVGLTVIGFPVGWVVSRVTLWLLFFGIITPLALVLRVIREDPLERSPRRQTSSYWKAKPPAPDVASYFRQF